MCLTLGSHCSGSVNACKWRVLPAQQAKRVARQQMQEVAINGTPTHQKMQHVFRCAKPHGAACTPKWFSVAASLKKG